MIRRSNYSIFLSSYSVGKEFYKEIPYVTRKYGKKAVSIGGKTAMAKAKTELLKSLSGTDFEITDFIWYGVDSNYENVEMLKKYPEVVSADMLLALSEAVLVLDIIISTGIVSNFESHEAQPNPEDAILQTDEDGKNYLTNL